MGKILEFPKEKHPHALQSSLVQPVLDQGQTEKQLRKAYLGVWKTDLGKVKKSISSPVTKTSIHRSQKKPKPCFIRAVSLPRSSVPINGTTNRHWLESPSEEDDEEDSSLSEPLHSLRSHKTRRPVFLKLAPQQYSTTENNHSFRTTNSEFSLPDSDEDDFVDSSESLTWLPKITELDCPSSEEEASVLDDETQADNDSVVKDDVASSGVVSEEDDVQRLTLQLSEKSLLLDVLRRDKDKLEVALQSGKDLVSRVVSRHEATRERLVQTRSESASLRQQLEDAKTKHVEHAIAAAQDSFSDVLARLRSDGEEKVKLAEEKNQELLDQIHELQDENKDRQTAAKQLQQKLSDSQKKLSSSEASLDVNTRQKNELEEEKSRLLKEIERVKGQLEESESQRVQAQRWITSLKCSLDEKENQFSVNTQKHQESLAALDVSCSGLRLFVDQLEKDKTELSSQVEVQKRLKEEAATQRETLQSSLHLEREKNAELREKIQRVSSKRRSEKHKQHEKDSDTNSVKTDPGQHLQADDAVERLKEKMDHLQMQLDMESSHRRELEKVNRKLKHHLAQQKRGRGSSQHLEQVEREVLDLKSRVETTKLLVEQYQRDHDKMIRQEVQQKLDQVNIFLQSQADCQDAMDQVRAAHEANVRYQLEQKIQELECELGRKGQHERSLNNSSLENVDFEGSCRMWPPWSQQIAMASRTAPPTTVALD